MQIAIIAAVADNRVIGLRNTIPWKLPRDMRRFKAYTMGKNVIMGRSTYESLKGNPLDGRRVIVLSKTMKAFPGKGQRAASLGDALGMPRSNEEVMIAGGARLYEEALRVADRMYLTRVHISVRGDTYFPEWNEDDWRLGGSEHYPRSIEDAHPSTFELWERKKEV